MLITSLLLAALAPAPASTVDATRSAFTKCLSAHLRKSLEAKMGEGEYALAIKEIRASERDAFRAAVIALDRSGGDSLASATADAEAQIGDYHDTFVDKFKDYVETKTLPSAN